MLTFRSIRTILTMPTTRAASKMGDGNADFAVPGGASDTESAAVARHENEAASTDTVKPDGLASLRKPTVPSHTLSSTSRRKATACDENISSRTEPKLQGQGLTNDQAPAVVKNIKGKVQKKSAQKKSTAIPVQHQLEALWHAGLFTVDDAIKHPNFKYPEAIKAVEHRAAGANGVGQEASVTVPLQQQRAVPKRPNASSHRPEAQNAYPRG